MIDMTEEFINKLEKKLRDVDVTFQNLWDYFQEKKHRIVKANLPTLPALPKSASSPLSNEPTRYKVSMKVSAVIEAESEREAVSAFLSNLDAADQDTSTIKVEEV